MCDARTLICACANAGHVLSARVAEVAGELEAAGRHCLVVDDLCGLAALRDPDLLELLEHRHVTIMACRPRAVRWLLSAAGADCGDRVQFVDLSDGNEPAHGVSSSGSGWIPWFPVIDYDRCCDCGQCLGFCLFGVYEKDEEGRARVVNPASCKTNCPACARICPEAAIMFPKLGEAPIDGSEITDEDAVRAKIKVNVEEVLGSDVYKALSERRSKVKKRLLKRREVDRALAERKACSEGGPVDA